MDLQLGRGHIAETDGRTTAVRTTKEAGLRSMTVCSRPKLMTTVIFEARVEDGGGVLPARVENGPEL
jgi:hypothetical protein